MATRKNRKWLWIGLGVFALLIIAAIIKSKNGPKGEEVYTTKVGTQNIRETVSASGKIFPETEVKISSDVSGEVVELYVEEGDSVRAGQLLARIDPDAYQSQVERGMAGVNAAKAQASQAKASISNMEAQRQSAAAQVEQIKANLANAKEIHKRNTELKAQGVISQADFDASMANQKSLEAQLRSAESNLRGVEASIEGSRQTAQAAQYQVNSSEASLKEVKTSLRRTNIVAPVSGVISKLNIEKGERVVGTLQMTGTEIMRIANFDVLEAKVDVSENDVLRVSIGDLAEIEADAYVGRKFIGKVTQIANSASNSATAQLTSDQVTNFTVTIRLEKSSYADIMTNGNSIPFRPGMSCSADIFTETKENIVAVPIMAVTSRDISKTDKVTAKKDGAAAQPVSNTFNDDVKEVVFVVSADTAKMVEVKTGIQNDEYIEVLSGLKAGDQVIEGPYSVVSRKLKSGMKVQVKDKAKVESSLSSDKKED